LSLSLLVFSLVYAAVFAIVTNNLEDLPTDRITNLNRPLVSGKVKPKQYLWAGIFCQVWLYCWLFICLSGYFGVILLHFFGMIFSYSCRPFQPQKNSSPSLKLIIGFNSLSGRTLWMDALRWRIVIFFPLEWIFFILIPLSLAANFVDLKDTEGDKLMNVRTLPVVLGQEKARHLIAGFTFV